MVYKSGILVLVLAMAFLLFLSIPVQMSNSEKDWTIKRIDAACSVQKNIKDTEMFLNCIEANKAMPYSVLTLAGRCSKVAGRNLSSFSGLYNGLCKKQLPKGVTFNTVAECLVKETKNIVSGKKLGLMSAVQKAFNIAYICAQEFAASKMAEGAAGMVAGATSISKGKLPAIG